MTTVINVTATPHLRAFRGCIAVNAASLATTPSHVLTHPPTVFADG